MPRFSTENKVSFFSRTVSFMKVTTGKMQAFFESLSNVGYPREGQKSTNPVNMSSPVFWPKVGTQSEDPRETVLIITAAKSATFAMDDVFAVGAFPFSKVDDWREFTAETAETDPWGGSGDCKVWPVEDELPEGCSKVPLVAEPAGSWDSQSGSEYEYQSQESSQ